MGSSEMDLENTRICSRRVRTIKAEWNPLKLIMIHTSEDNVEILQPHD